MESARTVTATLDRYFEGEGYGFATVEGEFDSNRRPIKVYFRKEGAREVDGTAFEPIMTGRPDNRFSFSTSRSITTHLVMQVVPGQNGRLRATAWGLRPRPYWVDRFIYEHTLERYIGGRVEISVRGRAGSTHYEGVLIAVAMTPDVLTLQVGQLQTNYQPADQSNLALMLSLAIASRKRTGMYGREVLEIEDGSDRYHIIFSPVVPVTVTGYTGD